jgi:hypothetical protein
MAMAMAMAVRMRIVSDENDTTAALQFLPTNPNGLVVVAVVVVFVVW